MGDMGSKKSEIPRESDAWKEGGPFTRSGVHVLFSARKKKVLFADRMYYMFSLPPWTSQERKGRITRSWMRRCKINKGRCVVRPRSSPGRGKGGGSVAIAFFVLFLKSRIQSSNLGVLTTPGW